MNNAKIIPEVTSGFVSQWTYFWINSLFSLGKSRPLQQHDLWQMPRTRQAAQISAEFNSIWEIEVLRARNVKEKPSLGRALMKFALKDLLLAGCLRLLGDALNISSPFLIRLLVNFVQDSKTFQNNDATLGYGMSLAAGLFLLSLFSTLFVNRYFHQCNIVALRLRTALTQSVYNKAIKLSVASRIKFNSGKVTTLVATDVARIDLFVQSANQIWIAPIVLCTLITLLCLSVGPSALAGIALIILTVPFQKSLMLKLRSIRAAVAPLTDQRVSLSQEAFFGIRVIKFFNWENSFRLEIEKIRKSEAALILKRGYLNAVAFGLAYGFPAIATVVTFVIYGVTNPLNPGNIFSSLSWFKMLGLPLLILPVVIGGISEVSVAIQRLEELFAANEIDEHIEHNPTASFDLEIQDGNFIWETLESDASDLPKIVQVGIENVEKGSPNHSSSESFKLGNINIQIPKGQLVAVIGTVGSGKSTLISSFLGETRKCSGKIIIRSSVGYAAQEAWIQNASVKDNILFGRPYDQEKYLKVIQSCALGPDLEVLPDGDSTQIGEKGINLSGGQKQRINLARILYSSPDIILMDDPLSAVDAHVGKHIFEQCIKIAMQGKTRLLVTHQLNYLSRVDHIIVMKNGTIIEQGSYNELLSRGGELTSIMKGYGVAGEASENNLEANGDGNENKNVFLIERDQNDARELMQKEEREIGTVSGKVWLHYMRAAGGWSSLLFAVIMMVLVEAAGSGGNYWLVVWTNNSIPNFSSPSYIAVYFGFAILFLLVTTCYGMLFSYFGVKAAVYLHHKALERIFRAPTLFFDTNPLGRIINRFSKDLDSVDNTMIDSFRYFCITLGSALSAFVIITYTVPQFVIPLVPALGLYYVVQMYYRATSRELKRLDSLARSPLYAHIGESLTGLSTIRAYAAQDRFLKTNEDLLDYGNRPNFILLATGRWLALRLETIGACLVFLAATFGVLSRNSQHLNPALMGLALVYALQITSMTNWCVRQFTELEVQMNAVERIVHYGNEIEQEAPAAIEMTTPPKDWPSSGNIEFRNVAMKYASDLPMVLRSISFSIQDQEKIGIVGRTGSGKSSLIQALFRMVEPAEGTIIVDGIVTNTLGLGDLRKGLGIIPQDPVVFSGTFRRNLDPFGEFSDQEVWDALERARIKEKVVESGGLEGKLITGGENLSVGQRQLICLARAMLQKPKILIMDEATANVDFETDSIIQQCLRSEFAKATILTIAHRLVDPNNIEYVARL